MFSLPIIAQAEDFAVSKAQQEPLKPRLQFGLMAGNERSIGTGEFWIPLYQNMLQGNVVYGDYRFSTDNGSNTEFNAGLGYRQMLQDVPLLGDGVAGIHGWYDRRVTKRGSHFNQITLGTEWFGKNWDFKVNGYMPLNDHKDHTQTNPNGYGASFSGTQLVVNTDQTVREEAMKGGDIEVGFRLPYMDDYTDSTRIYGAYYHFEGDQAEGVNGWRTRVRSDINEDITAGFRFQHDDVRGSQGFIELSIAFPFGNKKSYKQSGLWARMDESPERDIDIVSNDVITDDGMDKPVTSSSTGEALEVIHVDNTNDSGTEDGSAESPYNTLAEAEAAASANSVIYVSSGDGSSTGMSDGITLSQSGIKLIGSGTALTTDLLGISLPSGSGFSSSNTLIKAGSNPIITNASGDIITVNANDILVTGLTVDGSDGSNAYDGVVVEADGAGASATGVTIDNVTAINNRMGIYIHATNNGAASAKIESSITTNNKWHGISLYDDTDGTFEADLGGGSMGSSGNNILAANTLEDLAVDYDGRTLSAQNNWWGQASGADQDDPTIGIDPQIYYGAPLNDGLVLHLTFDDEWTTATIAYDRSGNDNDGTINGSTSATGTNGEALDFAGSGNAVTVSDNDSLDLADTLTILFYIDKDTSDAGFATHPIAKWTNTTDANFVFYDFGLTAGGALPDNNGFYANRGGVWGSITSQYDNSPGDGTNYIGMTYNSSTGGQLYVDGSSYGAIGASGALATNNVNLRIGGHDGFDGRMDDIRIYNRDLTSNEVAELYRMDTTSSVNVSRHLISAP